MWGGDGMNKGPECGRERNTQDVAVTRLYFITAKTECFQNALALKIFHIDIHVIHRAIDRIRITGLSGWKCGVHGQAYSLTPCPYQVPISLFTSERARRRASQ